MHGDMAATHELVDSLSPQMLLCCGDWGDPGQAPRADYERLIGLTHVLTVFGNHDDLGLLGSLTNADGSPVLLESGLVREALGLRVAGISGIWAKSHARPWYVTDNEVITWGMALEGRGVEILLTHGCPVGLCDLLPGGRHGGHRSFLDAVETVRAPASLCGHLHVQQVRTLKDGRIAANVGTTAAGDYVLIEKRDGEWKLQALRLEGRTRLDEA